MDGTRKQGEKTSKPAGNRFGLTGTSPKIRQASPDDCEAILRAYEASVSTLCAAHYNSDQIQSWLNHRQLRDYQAAVQNALVLVAEHDQEILGFAEMDRISGIIHALYVRPEDIGQGVGRALLGRLEQEARAAGLRRIQMDASLNSVAFLQARGFLPLGDSANSRSNRTALPFVRMEKWLEARLPAS